MGLNRIDEKQTVYITEGPSIRYSSPTIGDGWDVDTSNYNWDAVYIFDNEPRNAQICNRISQAIDRGNKVVIWNSNLKEKDLNDMVLSGHDVKTLVESNTYQGLEAKVKFTEWKRV